MATATRNNNDRTTEAKGEVTRVGNLTRDPELRFSNNGTAYCRFGLAVERPKKAGDWAGERVTEFYEVTCFGSLAENVAQSVAKGFRLVVSGRAEVEHWSTEAGEERTTKRIVADACGPELRWATAVVEKAERRPSGQRSLASSGSSGVEEEEPF